MCGKATAICTDGGTGLRERVKAMEQLPTEPMILLSVVNTKLRDFYGSLEELCEDLEVNPEELKQKFSQIDYVYNAELNRFI